MSCDHGIEECRVDDPHEAVDCYTDEGPVNWQARLAEVKRERDEARAERDALAGRLAMALARAREKEHR